MNKKKSKHKLITLVVLSILFSFLVYLSYSFVPGWLWHIDHFEGQAKIESVDSANKLFVYSYFNENEGKTITNQRKVEKIGDLEKIIPETVLPVTYSKYMSGYVRFKDVDILPSLVLTIGVYLLTLIGVLMYVGVLLNKISLETLAGVNKEGSLEGE